MVRYQSRTSFIFIHVIRNKTHLVTILNYKLKSVHIYIYINIYIYKHGRGKENGCECE